MTTPAMGHQAKLGIGANTTVERALEFVSENVRKIGANVYRRGCRGTRSIIAADARTGPYAVSGSIVLEPSPEDLAELLPWILGGNGAGGPPPSFPLTETLQTRGVIIDRIAKVFTYAACKVDQAIFRGRKGGLLELELAIEGLTESVGNAGTFGAVTISYTTAYIFQEVVLNLGGTAVELDEFTLTIANNLVKDRWLNSATRVSLPEGERLITLQTAIPYNATNVALYDIAIAGIAANMVVTSGNYSTVFTFGLVQAPPESPTYPGQDAEFMLPLALTAGKNGATNELVVTHDSTP